MRIEPIHTLVSPDVDRPNFLPSKFTSTHSSMESLNSRQKHPFIRFLNTTYNAIKEKLTSWYNWILSLFITPEEKEDVGYYKQAGSSRKEFAYKMTHKGKGTENVIQLGRKYTDLTQISFPDEKYRIDFPEMLDQLMEEENIDGIRTDKLVGAYQLWTCKLRTEAQLKYQLGARDLLSAFIEEVIRKAIQTRSSLPAKAKDILARVESMMIQSIVAEQIETTAGVSEKELHQSIAESGSQGFLATFDFARCRGRIDQLEAVLGNRFDLRAIIQQSNGERGDRFLQVLNRLSTERGPPLNSAEPFDLQIAVEDFFTLMEATKTKLNRAIIQPLPTITFTKRL